MQSYFLSATHLFLRHLKRHLLRTDNDMLFDVLREICNICTLYPIFVKMFIFVTLAQTNVQGKINIKMLSFFFKCHFIWTYTFHQRCTCSRNFGNYEVSKFQGRSRVVSLDVPFPFQDRKLELKLKGWSFLLRRPGYAMLQRIECFPFHPVNPKKLLY